ncbi:hypothetical protein QP445_14545, partial [Micrococcus luteus]|nr:hypothetical protein [Micrococcus luteus]
MLLAPAPVTVSAEALEAPTLTAAAPRLTALEATVFGASVSGTEAAVFAASSNFKLSKFGKGFNEP